MKLVFCPNCADFFRLWGGEMKLCKCRRSGGRYIDERNAEITGEAIPMGFGNGQFAEAILRYTKESTSSEIPLFTIPMPCRTIKKIGEKK